MANVLIINHYAGNKGDRAVLHFVIRELQRNGVENIAVSVHDRALWEHERQQWGPTVRLVPWGWNAERPRRKGRLSRRLWWERQRWYRKVAFPLVRGALLSGRGGVWVRRLANREFSAAIRRADLVISTGGHHMTTLLSPDGISETQYDMALALLFKKPLVLWSQSIGPFECSDRRNRELAGSILLGCREVQVRDIHSLVEIESLGVASSQVRETHESVLGMNDVVDEFIPPSQREPVVGIAIYAAQQREQNMHREYVDTIAALVDHAVATGCQVRFFPMELKDSGPDDRRLIRQILATATHGGECMLIDGDMDTFSHMNEVAKCRVFVGHKTHSAIFALAVGTPLVALAYHRKTEDFMEQYELKQNVIPDAQLNAAHLIEVFDRVCRDADSIAEQQVRVGSRLGTNVRADFCDMLKRRLGGVVGGV